MLPLQGLDNKLMASEFQTIRCLTDSVHTAHLYNQMRNLTEQGWPKNNNVIALKQFFNKIPARLINRFLRSRSVGQHSFLQSSWKFLPHL